MSELSLTANERKVLMLAIPVAIFRMRDQCDDSDGSQLIGPPSKITQGRRQARYLMRIFNKLRPKKPYNTPFCTEAEMTVLHEVKNSKGALFRHETCLTTASFKGKKRRAAISLLRKKLLELSTESYKERFVLTEAGEDHYYED